MNTYSFAKASLVLGSCDVDVGLVSLGVLREITDNVLLHYGLQLLPGPYA